MIRASARLGLALASLAACADDEGTTASGSGGEAGAAVCTLDDATSETSTVSPFGCAVLDRDASACLASRQAAGLTGPWLAFSCRVELGTAGGVVTATADGQPDYPSNYFPAGDACFEAFPEGAPNPNHIQSQALALTFPSTPDTTATPMGGGPVGLAVNGVALFANAAAPGQDIFTEAETFDRCGGHPDQQGVYHYHSEPLAISSDDARLVGVLRDGYPVYGRRDADGSLPSLDVYGGHTGPTPHSAADVYHYHVNEQISTSPGTAGESQWFLTTGTYRGAPAP